MVRCTSVALEFLGLSASESNEVAIIATASVLVLKEALAGVLLTSCNECNMNAPQVSRLTSMGMADTCMKQAVQVLVP